MKKLIIGLIVVLSIIIVGCQNEKPIGGDKDEYGCLTAAGYSWCVSSQKCIRAWEEECSSDGENIHVCTEEESLNHACTMEYAPVCGEIVLNMGEKVYQTFGNGCSACAAMKVTGYTQGECPPEKTTEMCSDDKGNYMTLEEAARIARSSECGDNLKIDCVCPEGYRKEGDSCNPECYYSKPPCLAPSTQCQKTYFCNEGTMTFWIELTTEKQGCSPACVIDIQTNHAEINWRCTGLLP
ncbi:MAG: hypothetical protein KKF44_02290 [Nanoarchaeota archaeon]|nr:hypothetical protein [Nanoarchaeota archaeon]